jgi:two-component system, sensor histidine kinase PdtaS
MRAFPATRGGRLFSWFVNLSTSVKLFGIISIALLPLGVVALIASLQANRMADSQRQSDLRIAVNEGARKLRTELGADLAALLQSVATMSSEGQSVLTCTRLDLMLHARLQNRPAFALFAPDRTMPCATPGFSPPWPSRDLMESGPAVFFTDDGIDLHIFTASGGAAVAHYPKAALLDFVRPVSLTVPSTITVADETHDLPLMANTALYGFGSETYTAPVELLGLNLRIAVDRPPFSIIDMLTAFLPLVMWASASIIAFFMVDRLLVRPLTLLRKAVGGFAPGAPIALPAVRTPAREIRDLADTFDAVGQTIAAHERSLATALADQVRLTREVHHRVKNNLQVVASLISLSARGAPKGPVAQAYASIQRRVDALSIVHRNHYAERDAHGGIDAKALIGELAANLRAGVALHGPAPTMAVRIAPVRLSQDVAVPVAFLITELTEASIEHDATAAIILSLIIAPGDPVASAILSIESTGLAAMIAGDSAFVARHGRILDGLARQLRVPMTSDTQANRYEIGIAILNIDHD